MQTRGIDKYARFFPFVVLLIAIPIFALWHAIHVHQLSVTSLWLHTNSSTSRSQSQTSVSEVKPVCSFKLFTNIAVGHSGGLVSGNGTWKRVTDNGAPTRFHPSICRFRHGVSIPSDEVVQCLRRKSVRSVAIAGDSNALRYYNAFHGLIGRAGGACTALKNDGSSGHHVDSNYYGTDSNRIGSLIVHDRDCSGCSNQKLHCTVANVSLTVELIALEFTNDAEVTSLHTYRQCVTNATIRFFPCHVTTTTQQFILKEYLGPNPPDLFIVFGNSHDSMRFTLREHAMNVRTFLDMIDIYLPASTKVVWTGKPSEDIGIKPGNYSNRIYESGKMDVMEWNAAANKIQYAEMRSSLLRGGRALPFIDLQAISEPVLRDWNIDGVHMQGIFYEHLISHLLQSFCADN